MRTDLQRWCSRNGGDYQETDYLGRCEIGQATIERRFGKEDQVLHRDPEHRVETVSTGTLSVGEHHRLYIDDTVVRTY